MEAEVLIEGNSRSVRLKDVEKDAAPATLKVSNEGSYDLSPVASTTMGLGRHDIANLRSPRQEKMRSPLSYQLSATPNAIPGSPGQRITVESLHPLLASQRAHRG